MAIEWERVGQARFDRIVEALIHRLYDATATVRAVNGRGGDGGIDIDVRQGERLRIYQLKYYPDGLQGRGRRPSIKKSFERAMDHDPYEWILVVPCTLTPGEQDFVEGLTEIRNVQIKVMNRAELDDRLATHHDIEASFARTQDDGGLLEYAKIMNRERDILANGTVDLETRVAALGRVIDDIDPHWTLDFARRGNTIVQTLRGKHPRAHEVSPITISLKGRAAALDGALSAALERVVGFGLAEDLTLPPEAVEQLTVNGPEWLAHQFSNVSVTWRPRPLPLDAGKAVEMAFLSDDDAVIASYHGTLNTYGQGSTGRSLAVDFDGACLQLMMPHDHNAASRLNFSLEVTDRETSTALRAIRLHKRLRIGGRFEISVEDRIVCSGIISKDETGDEANELSELIFDLEAVQRHCERYFPVPDEISARERILLRLARRLVDGQCVINPFAKTLRFTLNGTGRSQLLELLGGGAIFVTRPDCPISIAGHTLDLGPVRIFHPHATVDDVDQARAAIDTDDFSGLQLTLRPVENQHYRLILESALANLPPEQPVLATPFTLVGYTEPA
ncbi:hypothetical protein OG301_29480 [Streptomyces platensis]|uniref:hypothetical protein n=1 Tax=Streptomyces platensis TaxID=58346 RepID=UPI002ED36E64|nr:hypothetical protein OG301_29480 [Streptomyces platensis]